MVFLALLCDAEDNADVLQYSPHKSRRVVRSVLGGEVMAFADYFEYGLAIPEDLERITVWKLEAEDVYRL